MISRHTCSKCGSDRPQGIGLSRLIAIFYPRCRVCGYLVGETGLGRDGTGVGSNLRRFLLLPLSPRVRTIGFGLLWLGLAGWIIWADYLSSLNISFPVTYILPILFAANVGNRNVALALAVAMPFARLRLEGAASGQDPLVACVIQSFVLGFIAVLVDRQHQHLRNMRGLLRMCAWCKRIHVSAATWEPVETFLKRRGNTEFTHGLCPDCSGQYEECLRSEASLDTSTELPRRDASST